MNARRISARERVVLPSSRPAATANRRNKNPAAYSRLILLVCFEQYFAEEVSFDDPPAGEPSAPRRPAEEPAAAAGDDALRRLLSDPAQLAADLEALTHALQGLSETLRRSAGDARKEDDR